MEITYRELQRIPVRELLEKVGAGGLTVRVKGERKFEIRKGNDSQDSEVTDSQDSPKVGGLWIPLAPAEIDYLEAKAREKGLGDAVTWIKRGIERQIEGANQGRQVANGVPVYDWKVHKGGERVRVWNKDTKQWDEVIAPKLDEAGQVIIETR